MSQGLALAACGIAVGAVAALALAKAIVGPLCQVSWADPMATRTDPVTALRG